MTDDVGLEPHAYETLRLAIRERRLARGLTLTTLASQAELSQPFLSQIENGRARPSMMSLYRIAYALGTPIEDPRLKDRLVVAGSTRRVLHERAKLGLNRFVEQTCEGRMEPMNRDEFDHIGEVFVRSPEVAETASELRLNQRGQ